MKKVSRYIGVDVRKRLMKRANGMCEVCGMDIATDKHHIYEFVKGGESSVENLICFCPTCHRQLPVFLTHEQQHYLQEWHKNNTENNYSLNHHISSDTNTIVLGTNQYTGCSSILSIYDQKVIRTYERSGKFYLNAVMLENCDPQILLLGNRIIYSANDIDVYQSKERVSLQKDGEIILEVVKKEEGIISAQMSFYFNDNGSTLLFDFNDKSSQVFNNTFEGCTLMADGGTAFSYKGTSRALVAAGI